MNKLIKNLHIRNFRSLAFTSMRDCGPLNVLIGKNNAGKSSALVAIPLIFEHLASGRIASPWRSDRHAEQYTHRDTDRLLQLGVELALSESVREALRDQLRATAPHLGKSIEQLQAENSVSFIFRFVYDTKAPYQYIESISFGEINNTGELLLPTSTLLLETHEDAARSLFQTFQSTEQLRQKTNLIKKLVESDRYAMSSYFSDKRNYPARYIVDRLLGEDSDTSGALRKELTSLLESSESAESFRAKASAESAAANDEIERIARTEIDTPLLTYTGEVRVQPHYVSELCKAFGMTPILRLGERKQPIGRKEAARLLQLKVKRGGPERLQIVQNTVKALLGVSLDAFQGDGERESAEIDVDHFLAEANGAGIRESLRLILDLELEPCEIVLVEEPEVHLHPGLEFAVHSYLQEKSKTKQFFVTTHSTNFVDTVSPQHIYLISRDKDGISACERLADGEAPMKLPAELGIRLSTVFMFDRILFVEGPSDESVLRELARTAGFDLNGAGVAFVHMGGISNFTHYAAQATLELLSRRRVQMWFLVDRDERDESDIRKMVDRLGDQAKLIVLQRRELENFLVDEGAVLGFVAQKTGTMPSATTFKVALSKVVESLAEVVANLYLEKHSLSPIYLRGQGIEGSIEDRLAYAIQSINERVSSLQIYREQIFKDTTAAWSTEKALNLAPGSLLLDRLCREFGCSFDKARGDSVKLARHLGRTAIHRQITDILAEVSRRS